MLWGISPTVPLHHLRVFIEHVGPETAHPDTPEFTVLALVSLLHLCFFVLSILVALGNVRVMNVRVMNVVALKSLKDNKS